MPPVRTAAALLLGLLGVWVIAGNLWLVARWLLRRKHGSFTPLLGGLSGAAALALSDATPTVLWVLPLVVDPGSLPLAIATGVAWVRR